MLRRSLEDQKQQAYISGLTDEEKRAVLERIANPVAVAEYYKRKEERRIKSKEYHANLRKLTKRTHYPLTDIPKIKIITKDSLLWQNDMQTDHCFVCEVPFNRFSLLRRKHHCRTCGNVVCNDCSKARCFGPDDRSCDTCMWRPALVKYSNIVKDKADWVSDDDPRAVACQNLDCTSEVQRRARFDPGRWEGRHHCRLCGQVYCQACSSCKFPLKSDNDEDKTITFVRCCVQCMASFYEYCTKMREKAGRLKRPLLPGNKGPAILRKAALKLSIEEAKAVEEQPPVLFAGHDKVPNQSFSESEVQARVSSEQHSVRPKRGESVSTELRFSEEDYEATDATNDVVEVVPSLEEGKAGNVEDIPESKKKPARPIPRFYEQKASVLKFLKTHPDLDKAQYMAILVPLGEMWERIDPKGVGELDRAKFTRAVTRAHRQDNKCIPNRQNMIEVVDYIYTVGGCADLTAPLQFLHFARYVLFEMEALVID